MDHPYSSSFPALVRERAPAHDDLDAIEQLGDEIATLAAHIHAATQRLLMLIAEFDRRGGWELDGHRSCAHWLAFRTGIDLGAAREKVRTARVLVGLPETSASMARGELSFSQVRALSRVATPENEGDLLELARGCTTAQLERVVRAWKRGSREDEAAMERERWDRRRFSVVPDDDGMYDVCGKLPPEIGALLMRAIEAASDALYREQVRGAADEAAGGRGAGGGATADCADAGVADEEHARAAARRRADAIGLLAERAMAAGFGTCRDDRAPVSGTRAERYQVVLHVEPATLATDGDPGRSDLEDGTRVSAETSRRLSCDAGLVRIERAADGSILDVGRRTRTITPALRRALDVRDRGCRFPGCGLRFTDAHHLRHWADGGETSLKNTVLLCRHHHRLVHEGGWSVEWWGEGSPVFYDPRGGTHFEGRREAGGMREEAIQGVSARGETPADEAAEGGGPADEAAGGEGPAGEAAGGQAPAVIARENRRLGVDPDWRTAAARWKSLEDVPDDIYFRAVEAMG